MLFICVKGTSIDDLAMMAEGKYNFLGKFCHVFTKAENEFWEGRNLWKGKD